VSAASPLGSMVIVIPTYNEAENLEWIVGRVLSAAPTAHVLVVDDGSPDGTGEIADRLAADEPRVSAVHRSEKAGLGAAYLHGFRVALDQGYDVVGEMDADGSHQPEQLHRLVDAIEGADLVIGARWIPGGSVVSWSRFRKLLSMGGNAYARLLLGVGVHDVTSGYRLFRASALRAIDLESVVSTGYCFQTDLALRCVRAGLRVREVPIEFLERERGESKMDGAVAVESLRRITRWGVQQQWARLSGQEVAPSGVRSGRNARSA
jgi:dolichol-phosphate mannosyltransferase